jgi:hypothetical protein
MASASDHGRINGSVTRSCVSAQIDDSLPRKTWSRSRSAASPDRVVTRSSPRIRRLRHRCQRSAACPPMDHICPKPVGSRLRAARLPFCSVTTQPAVERAKPTGTFPQWITPAGVSTQMDAWLARVKRLQFGTLAHLGVGKVSHLVGGMLTMVTPVEGSYAAEIRSARRPDGSDRAASAHIGS